MPIKRLHSMFNLRGCIYDLLRGIGLDKKNYEKLQGERLKTIVRHAYENVDFYRKKYDETGVKPGDIRSLEDISKLPIITKNDLVENSPDGFLSHTVDVKDCLSVASTGTTGKSVRLYHRKYRRSDLLKYAPAALLVPSLLKNINIKEIRRKTMAIVATDEECVAYATFREIQKIPKILRGELNIVNALDEPEIHFQALKKYTPDVLVTYPSVLRNLAVFTIRNKLTVPQPKLLVVGGELMDGHSRKSISDTFKGKMIENYGATEVGTIARSCPDSQSLHISCMLSILEVLKDGKPASPGVPGNVVVTSLWHMTSPMIRYSGLDDVVSLSDEQCSCGNRLPLIKVIEGRSIDSFILPDGSITYPSRLIFALARIPQIAYHQIIQEETDKVRILIVEQEGRSHGSVSPFQEGEPLRAMITERFREILGNDVHITIDVVKDIPKPPGARFFPVIRSLVNKPE